MSKNLERVIQRAISDAAFRRELQSNPEAALRGFKLTESEVAALRSGDAGKLTSLGIDQRMSKTFTFGSDDLASRVSPGGDLTSASLAHTDQDFRANSAVVPGGGGAGGTSSAIEAENTYSAGIIPGVGDGDSRIGDPMSGGLTASNIGDPDNPAVARGYVGQDAAPTSDAIEDQSHAIAARQFGQVTNAGVAAPIEGSPEEFSFRDQASTTTASNIGDPDNPANARGYVGQDAAAPTSDALEDQSHAIAARQFGQVTNAGLAAPTEGSPEEFSFRDQASTANASISDPSNPAFARGFIGDQSDAFLSEGEVSKYSADPNWSSDQAEDTSHAFKPGETGAVADEGDTVDDADTASVRHQPDIPS